MVCPAIAKVILLVLTENVEIVGLTSKLMVWVPLTFEKITKLAGVGTRFVQFPLLFHNPPAGSFQEVDCPQAGTAPRRQIPRPINPFMPQHMPRFIAAPLVICISQERYCYCERDINRLLQFLETSDGSYGNKGRPRHDVKFLHISP